MQVTHKIMPPQGVNFPICRVCKYVALDKSALTQHETEKGHVGKAPVVLSNVKSSTTATAKTTSTAVKKPSDPDDLSCDMCEKTFMNKKALSMHRVAKHRRRVTRAKKDDSDEDEEEDDDDEEDDEQDVDFDSALQEDVDYVPNKSLETAKKVKVLSNVSVKGRGRSSEADSLSTVATGIATSLGLGGDGDQSAELEYEEEEEHIVDEAAMIESALANVHGEGDGKHDSSDLVETKFLAEDGSELQLTPEQKAELISQLDTSDGDHKEVAAAAGEDVVMMYEEEAVDESMTEEDESGQVLKDGDQVLMVYGGPRGNKTGNKSKVADEVVEEEEKMEQEDVVDDEDIVKEEQPSMELEEEAVITETEEDIDHEEKVQNEKNKLIKELEGDWDDDTVPEEEIAPVKEESKEAEVTETKESSAAIKLPKAPLKPTAALDSPEKVDRVIEEEVVDAIEGVLNAVTGEIESVTKDDVKKIETTVETETSEKKDTLAEFMDDWNDE